MWIDYDSYDDHSAEQAKWALEQEQRYYAEQQESWEWDFWCWEHGMYELPDEAYLGIEPHFINEIVEEHEEYI